MDNVYIEPKLKADRLFHGLEEGRNRTSTWDASLHTAVKLYWHNRRFIIFSSMEKTAS